METPKSSSSPRCRSRCKKLDSFNEDVLMRIVHRKWEAGEPVTLSAVANAFKEEVGLSISKFVVQKIFHQHGFRFKVC